MFPFGRRVTKGVVESVMTNGTQEREMELGQHILDGDLHATIAI